MQKFISEPIDAQGHYAVKRYNMINQEYELFEPEDGTYYTREQAEERAHWHNSNIG